ncbi:hypothetical protein A3D03_00345 [Candidatus Gottesmanbacteria bacterium RIFCSPHIGHO2_02_FULL_40_13]|uniref:Metallo-beta-lactamase domain-containing protein n=1 Tax=Candidatus Gottesmanbacteria bacterium RIFCSPHIGHO2_02_FULL_40_13 TaxID=1798384 RepID=A0A1F6A541_9BACT|nr:MAG: hypothetical protein A3D03_00345 [Candidatus Gottesmanbacteria bacterium RIFCSPHIGHO2_02_FULL_40_13]
MNVIPLGTNGFFPSFGRETMCFAVPYGKTLIILDAGTGLYRLAEPIGKKLLTGVENIHLFLSHYHLDHTFGFYGAFNLLKGKKITVFGSRPKKVFSELPALGYFPVKYDRQFSDFNFKQLTAGKQEVDDYAVFVKKQYHRGEGSLALRFEFISKYKTSLAYVTDSEPTQEGVKFVKNTTLLLHEHWFNGNDLGREKGIRLEDQLIDGHVTTIGAALIAKEAKAGKLCLAHHYPFYNAKQLENQRELARKIFPKTELALDLSMVSF